MKKLTAIFCAAVLLISVFSIYAVNASPEPIYTERFEDDQGGWIFNVNKGGAVNTLPEILNGTQSFKTVAAASSGGDGNSAFFTMLSGKSASMSFSKNASYTFSFRYSTVVDTVNAASYIMLALKTPTGGSANDKYIRFKAGGAFVEGNQTAYNFTPKTGYNDYTVSFTMGNYDDYYMEFVIHRQGQIIIDDIRVFEGQITPPEDIAVDAREPVPELYFTERFENVNLRETYFFVTSGEYMRNGNQINGKYSPLLKRTSDDWTKMLTLNIGKATFLPLKTYTVVMKYRVTEDTGASGFFQLAMSTVDGTYMNDRYVRFTAAGVRNNGNENFLQITDKGDYSECVVTFALANYNDYDFSISTFAEGCMIVDDISFFKGSLYESDDAVNKQNSGDTVLFNEDFESLDSGNAGYYMNNGTISFKMPDILNGHVSYEVASTPEEWTRCLVSRRDRTPLEALKTYTVSFKYRITENNGSGGFFQLAATTASGGYLYDQYIRFDHNDSFMGGNANMFRLEDNGGYKTCYVTFSLENLNDYELIFAINGSGKMLVDDIRVWNGMFEIPDTAANPSEKPPEDIVLLYEERFESEQVGDWLFRPTMGQTVFDGDVINGGQSYRLMASGGEWTRLLETSSAKVRLERNHGYAVTFRIKPTKPTGDGYFMFAARTDAGTPLNDLFIRFDDTGKKVEGNVSSYVTSVKDGVITCAVVFFTRDWDDYRLAFSIFKQGEAIIDDIRVFSGNVFGDDAEISKSPKTPKLIRTETFENDTDMAYYPESGQLTAKKPDIINGSFSYAFKAAGEWTQGLMSDTNKIKMTRNGTYTLTFKARADKATAKDSFYQLAFKTGKGGPSNDSFVRFDSDGNLLDSNAVSYKCEKAGGFLNISVTACVGNFDDYQLAFAIHNSGRLIIDDISLFSGICAKTDTVSNVKEIEIKTADKYDAPELSGQVADGIKLDAPKRGAAKGMYEELIVAASAGESNPFIFIIIGAVALLVIAAGLTGFFMLRKMKKGSKI